MAWRLVDVLQNEKDPLRLGVLMQFYMESNPMAAVEWDDKKSLRLLVQRLNRTSLTKPSWVPISTAYGEATPQFDPIQEAPYKLGQDIDTPLEYDRGLDGQFEDLRALGTEAALKAIAYEVNEAFINGPAINADGSSNANAVVGIRQRITDTTLETGAGDALVGTSTLFGPTSSNANKHQVLDNLNTAIYYVDGHQPDWAFGNDSLLLALESALRQLGLFDQNRDQYDRFVYRYRNVEMYDIGLAADQTTRIIPNTESLGGNTDNTSVYFGKNGVGTHFWAWEAFPLDVRDLGELQASPNYRTRVDWMFGFVNAHYKALARVRGIRATT